MMMVGRFSMATRARQRPRGVGSRRTALVISRRGAGERRRRYFDGKPFPDLRVGQSVDKNVDSMGKLRAYLGGGQVTGVTDRDSSRSGSCSEGLM
jgi:hypothetical protein